MTSDPKASRPNADTRRKRLRFQCWHRGTKEMDLILGGFAERHLSELGEAELDMLERLLAVVDTTLYLWISGQQTVPAEFTSPMLHRLKTFVASKTHG
jgi:antitoxin CptB